MFHPKIKRPAIVVTFLIAAVIGMVCGNYFDGREVLLTLQHQARMQEANARWPVREKELTAKHVAEMEAAMGGAEQVAIKDPRKTITEMLRLRARAAAPMTAGVEVRVDRFTEFDVDFFFTRHVDDREMATITKRFLAESSRYVNSIRFVENGQIIAEADKRKIDSVPDWKTVSLDELR